MTILDKLINLKDDSYADFSAKLTPTIDRELFLGVRVPNVRKLAKEIEKDSETKEFIKTLPHKYYDENMLHGLLLSNMKDYDTCVLEVDKFLPYVDNWAVCDIMSPKVFKKNKDKLLVEIKRWVKSKETYTIRFGIEMLMSFYLDNDFKEEYLDIVTPIRSDEYYVNMMIAWFMATALTKKWDTSIKVIENYSLDKWCHNKSIQKAIESYRITDTQKEYLRSLKIK